MNIKIKKLSGDYSTNLNRKVTMDLLDFAELVGAKIDIIERENDEYRKTNKIPRYYAKFKNCEAKEGGALVGYFGNGNNINRALSDYAKEISGKILVFGAWSGCNRWEIKAPKLVYMPNKKVKKMFSDYSNA